MSNPSEQLPAGFQALEPFVDGWAIDGANNRLQRRLNSEDSERTAFFQAGKDLVAPALDLLDRKSLTDLDAREERLMNLMLSLAHISLAVEVQRDDEPFHAKYARYINITRASADDNP